MNFIELGKENSKVCVLFHGGGLQTWQFKDLSALLKEKYHVIMPIIEGHGSGHFISIEESAKNWISFIEEKFDGQIELLIGTSLGGQIALEMLVEKNDLAKYLILESAALKSDRLTASLIPMSFKMAYPLIKERWFSKLQFQSLKIKEEFFEDYYKTTTSIRCEDLIAFTKASALFELKEDAKKIKAKTLYLYGSKEVSRIKESAFLLKEKMGAKIIEIKGLAHGEFGMKKADEFYKIIEEFQRES